MTSAAVKPISSTETTGDVGVVGSRWAVSSPSHSVRAHENFITPGLGGMATSTGPQVGQTVVGSIETGVTGNTDDATSPWSRPELRGMRLVLQRVKHVAREVAAPHEVAFSTPATFEFADEGHAGEGAERFVQLAVDVLLDTTDRETVSAFRRAFVRRVAAELDDEELARLSLVVTGN